MNLKLAYLSCLSVGCDRRRILFGQNTLHATGCSQHCVCILQENNDLILTGGVTIFVTFIMVIKGKSVPLQAWSGPEGSSKLRFPDFMTTAQDGGKVVSLTHRLTLPPVNTPGTHFS